MALTKWKREMILHNVGYICQYCGIEMDKTTWSRPDSACVNHVIPVSLGGADDETNAVAACFRCVQVKNGLGTDVLRYTHNIDLLRRVINDTRRCMGLPSNPEYRSPEEKFLSGKLDYPAPIKVRIPDAEVVIMKTQDVKAAAPVDVVDIQLAEFKREQESRDEKRARECKEYFDAKDRKRQEQQKAGGIGNILDSDDDGDVDPNMPKLSDSDSESDNAA